MGKPELRPTHRTIALEAGVSSVTVSLALRDHPKIPEVTRRRIHKIAKDQGYIPDPEIAKLMVHLRKRRSSNHRSNLTALRLVPPPGPEYAAYVLEGAMERAAMLGYSLEVINLNLPKLSPGRLEKILRNRGVEGLLLLPVPPHDLSARLNWMPFSVVACTHSVLQPRFHTVVPNQFSNMIHLCEELSKNDDNRIGMLTRKITDLRVNHRFISAYQWHSTYGNGNLAPPFYIDEKFEGQDALLGWIEKYDINLIVTERGVIEEVILPHFPRELIRRIKWIQTALLPGSDQPGIFEHPERIGSAAIDFLAGMIQRGERGIPDLPFTLEIEGTVHL